MNYRPGVMTLAAPPQPAIEIVSGEPDPPVSAINNHVYFYSEINSVTALDLIKALREADVKLRQERIARDIPADYPPTPIWLHVHSPGGYTPAAFAAADTIRALPSPVWSIVEGLSYSGATFLSMAARRRFIQPTAMLMIHALSGDLYGTYSQLQDSIKMYDMEMDKIAAFYQENSKMTAGEVAELLERDSWLTPADCLRLGIVDEVMR